MPGLIEKNVGPNYQVTWHGKEVYLILEQATADALEAAALSVESNAKRNIVNNDQVDTGFMLNSVYAVGQGTKEVDNFYRALGDAKKQNGDAVFLSREEPPKDGLSAIVAVGAEYGIFQELINSFLFLALQQEADQFGGKLVEKTKAAGL